MHRNCIYHAVMEAKIWIKYIKSHTPCIEKYSLKNAIITPVHKKGAKTFRDNYRPVSILSNISEIYERLMFKQISEYFEPILSKFQCGFRKGLVLDTVY